MTEIIDGKAIARSIEGELKDRSSRLKHAGVEPTLAVVLFGDDQPSRVYGRMIERGCDRIGIRFRLVEEAATVSVEEAEERVDELNADPSVHGIIIKRPLPGALADERLLQRTLPRKDVDGYHFENLGRLVIGGAHAAPVPCTPAGVMELLRRTGHRPAGRHVVILGRSPTVGKPLANLLAQKDDWANATVTICHRHTTELEAITRQADIVVTAIGVPRFLTPTMVAPGAIVIDVGTNVVDDPSAKKGYRLVGDADFDQLVDHCAAITPVPGGVGPVTVAMLMKTVLDSAEGALSLP